MVFASSSFQNFRQTLYTNTLEVLRKAEGTRPEVRKVKLGAETLVLKDYYPLGRIKRQLGRILIWREARALRLLSPLRVTVSFKARVGPYALLTRFEEGTPLHCVPRGELHPVFWDKLKQSIRAVHARGFLLADVKSSNIIVSENNRPVLVDLASAVRLPKPLLAYFKKLDERKLCQIILDHDPSLLTPGEKKKAFFRFPLEGLIRRGAHRARKLLKRIK